MRKASLLLILLVVLLTTHATLYVAKTGVAESTEESTDDEEQQYDEGAARYQILAHNDGDDDVLNLPMSVVRLSYPVSQSSDDTSRSFRFLRVGDSIIGAMEEGENELEAMFGGFAIMQASCFCVPASAKPLPKQQQAQALILGLGIGTVPKFLLSNECGRHSQFTNVVAVELSKTVSEWAKTYFGLEILENSGYLNIVNRDAKQFLMEEAPASYMINSDRQTQTQTQAQAQTQTQLQSESESESQSQSQPSPLPARKFDLVVMDLYFGGRNPTHVLSLETFELLRSKWMNRRSTLVLNFVGFSASDSKYTLFGRSVANTMRAVFPSVKCFREGMPTTAPTQSNDKHVDWPGNIVCFAKIMEVDDNSNQMFDQDALAEFIERRSNAAQEKSDPHTVTGILAQFQNWEVFPSSDHEDAMGKGEGTGECTASASPPSLILHENMNLDELNETFVAIENKMKKISQKNLPKHVWETEGKGLQHRSRV